MPPPRPRTTRPPAPAPPSRFDLYERCVQAPGAMARFLDAVHGASPALLREDFSGGGAICKAWVARTPGRAAIAVDLDAHALARMDGIPAITTVRADVRAARHRADIIAALNFPLGYFYTRTDLLAYLKASRARLRPKGVFVADTYGGDGAFDLCTREATFTLPGGAPVRYQWEQRAADRLTRRVFNAIHFTVRRPRLVMKDAFTYDWRLWDIPELRDAYLDAGFRSVEVYDQQAGAIDVTGRLHLRPVEHGDELDDDYVVYVVGRA